MATFGGRDYSQDRPGEQRPQEPAGAQGPAPAQGYAPQGAPAQTGGQGGQGYAPQGPQGGPDAPRGYQRDQGGGYAGDDPRGGSGGGYRGNGGGRSYGGGRGGYGGGRGGGQGADRDPNFAFISYLYGPNSKGGYTVFLKRDMLEILKSMEEDDILGIAPSGRDGWMFYARRVDPADKEDFRRRGGRGGGGRGGYRR